MLSGDWSSDVCSSDLPYNTRFVFHSSPIRKSTVQNGQLHYTIIAFPGFQCFCGQNKKNHHLKAALPFPGEVRPPSVDTVYTDSIIFLSFLQTAQPLRLLYFSALIRSIPWKNSKKTIPVPCASESSKIDYLSLCKPRLGGRLPPVPLQIRPVVRPRTGKRHRGAVKQPGRAVGWFCGKAARNERGKPHRFPLSSSSVGPLPLIL